MFRSLRLLIDNWQASEMSETLFSHVYRSSRYICIYVHQFLNAHTIHYNTLKTYNVIFLSKHIICLASGQGPPLNYLVKICMLEFFGTQLVEIFSIPVQNSNRYNNFIFQSYFSNLLNSPFVANAHVNIMPHYLPVGHV